MPPHRKDTRRIWVLTGLAIVAIFAVIYFFTGGSSAPGGGQMGMEGPMPVNVLTVQEKNVRTWTTFSGRLVAVDNVEIRPRVGGAIDKVLFTEGAIVKKGDPLFLIDPRTYEAAVSNAEAALTSARNNAILADREQKRGASLLKNKFIPESRYDERLNAAKVARANVQAAEANLHQAKLNLEYAHIKAPVSGRVSRAEITVGNIVEAGPNAPVLTTIVSNAPIYVDFDVDEATYLSSVRTKQSSKSADVPVELALQSDPANPYTGRIQSFDNQLNPTSGTIRARAIFANEDGVLVPGMFADVRLGNASMQNAIIVPDKVIGTDQDKRFVYVVGESNKVAYRPVILGMGAEGGRIITEGLKSGERIVVSGLQRIRPDMEIQPMEGDSTTPASSPAPAAQDQTSDATPDTLAKN